MKTTYKVTHATGNGHPVLRKLVLDTASIVNLIATVRERFQFDSSTHLELFYRDEDGDLITLSSDQELQELLTSPDAQNGVVRLEVRESAASQPAASASVEEPAEQTPASPIAADDWLEVESVEDEPLIAPSIETYAYGSYSADLAAVDRIMSVSDQGPPTTAADPADPAEPVLPGSFATRLEALIDAEFPRDTTMANATPGQATPTVAESESADPAEEPLASPGVADPAEEVPTTEGSTRTDGPPPAFSTLPGSFSSILSGLPTHAEAISAQLATLVGSPNSALGRLSSILSNPTGAVSSGAINLSDLSSSFSNLGVDVSAAVHEVLQSVRSEADGVRSEFERFKSEVEAEKAKFEQEVRAALEEAKRARAEAASAAAGVAAPAQDASTQVPSAEDEHKGKDRSAPHHHAHAHREAKEARRSAREQRWHDRSFESPYSWGARYTSPADHGPSDGSVPGMSGGWCRQSKNKWTTAPRSGWASSSNGWGASAAAPPPIMRDAPYGMPGSMPFSSADPTASKSGSSGWGAPPATTATSSWASPPPTTNATANVAEEDGDKPVLLTAFLGAARSIGFDVDDAGIRTALTDIWCDSNGRGLSAMLDKACEELFS
ncbi:hypothetical protein JCM10908_003781 [Rhodotorula pacifica]|uniref:uncharacterized protein n=1 Tax=Rhodotorula pacifica TaxID=1495444 RepID=UPI003178EDA6